MKILLTGASGFIGTRFCDLFPGRIYRLGHIESVAEVVEKMKQVNPDCVVHLAGLFIGQHSQEDIDPLIDSNIRFGARVLEAMSECGIKRIVTAGTYWQHYNDRLYSPVNLYAATKQAFESILDYYCEAEDFTADVLLVHDTYGPNDYRKKLFQVLHEIDHIKIPHEDRYIDFVYVDDVCMAINVAVENTRIHKGKKRYVISTKNPVTLVEAIEKWCEATGNNIAIIRNGHLKREMQWPLDGEWVPGWKPSYDLSEGLRKTYA